MDARVSKYQQLLNPEDDFDMYKSQQAKPRHIVQTQSNKNKQEIIMQLNKKLEGGNSESRDKKRNDVNINKASFSSKSIQI